MRPGLVTRWRVAVVAVLLLIGFASVGLRLAYLQVFAREKFIEGVSKARGKQVDKKGWRGDILDARGDVLATTRPVWDVGVDPQAVLDRDKGERGKLAELLGLPLAEVEAAFERKTRETRGADGIARTVPNRWVFLKKGVEEETYRKILGLGFNGRGIKGVRSEPDNQPALRRAYPHGPLAAHVIGFVDKADGRPLGGVERFADFYLQGKDGWRETEKDGLGRERAEFIKREVPAERGYDVQLTIDMMAQHLAEEEVAAITREFSPAKVSVIISDPRTGFILALANHPTFDPNDYNKLTKEEHARMRNIAVTDILEPGSTFKIVAVAGALDAGRVTPETRFDCSRGSIEYKGVTRRFMPDDHPADHPLSVAEILAQSSNVGTPQVAMTLGDEKFHEYVRAFGFGEKTGFLGGQEKFPFGVEHLGFVRPPADWKGTDITRIPDGYSVAVTPMQIHMAMAALANGGRLLRPQVIRRVKDAEGGVVFEAAPVVRRAVVAPETAALMARLLRGVVTEGTGRAADIPGHAVAGKTGTAQKVVNKRYSPRNHVGSFVGFFPAESPRVVISVIVDDGRPANGRPGYGAVVAAPGFRRIGARLAQYLDIKPAAETPASGGVLASGRGAR
ncbi:MAG: penicillin-binding protein 2 [Opitutaceae bacterium]|jgi:cell division protein FtsI/penicillin-binding protein 2|nr:penicillin-binding protein 2 [Opitutaceae bacterium]